MVWRRRRCSSRGHVHTSQTPVYYANGVLVIVCRQQRVPRQPPRAVLEIVYLGLDQIVPGQFLENWTTLPVGFAHTKTKKRGHVKATTWNGSLSVTTRSRALTARPLAAVLSQALALLCTSGAQAGAIQPSSRARKLGRSVVSFRGSPGLGLG